MTNAPIRIVVLLAVISLAGIIATQIYLTNRAVSSNEQQFNHSVQMALRNVVESLCEINGNDIPSNDPIDQVSSGYFAVRTNDKIDLKSLDYLLKAEFEKRAIEQDFEYGVYDCQNKRMVYGDFINMTNKEPFSKIKSQLPELEGLDYYFGVYFPNKTVNILWGIEWWKYTTGLTLIVIIFFGYSLFIILKQKKLSSIQRDFINNITHEFKTPLATLKIASSVLGEPTTIQDADRIKKYSEIIQTESSRLERHVEQLLKSAFLEHKRNFELKRVDVSKVAEEVLNSFDLKRSSIKLTIKCDQTINVIADQYLFSTALFNLVDNAIKYGNNEVKITIQEEGGKGVISVKDNGTGVSKREQKNIFKKFYRISQGDQHNVKGFGLGLYTVKESIALMNGSISVNCDEGCKFIIKLPLA